MRSRLFASSTSSTVFLLLSAAARVLPSLSLSPSLDLDLSRVQSTLAMPLKDSLRSPRPCAHAYHPFASFVCVARRAEKMMRHLPRSGASFAHSHTRTLAHSHTHAERSKYLATLCFFSVVAPNYCRDSTSHLADRFSQPERRSSSFWRMSGVSLSCCDRSKAANVYSQRRRRPRGLFLLLLLLRRRRRHPVAVSLIPEDAKQKQIVKPETRSTRASLLLLSRARHCARLSVCVSVRAGAGAGAGANNSRARPDAASFARLTQLQQSR